MRQRSADRCSTTAMSSLDTTHKSTPRPSKEQIEQVQQVLEEPLSNKPVMIPFTTRAFFPGSLQPTTSFASGEEQVLVRMGGDLFVEMERKEARDYLQKRAESCMQPEQQQQETTVGRKAAAPSAPLSSDALPCFEIREEYDETGRQVKAEAVNVMKELEYLERQGKEEAAGASSDISDITVEPPDASDESGKIPARISDEQYSVLSRRLDELARLEEEAETTQKVNKKSATKLQGGWAKGFLNKKKAPAGKTTTNTPKHVPPAPIPGVSETPTSSSTATNRKVAFRQEDEVREIPRIGERSASELRPPPSLPTRKPIESDVFSGVIRERTVEESQASNAHDSSKKPTPQKKKLSRFAQERMQGGL